MKLLNTSISSAIAIPVLFLLAGCNSDDSDTAVSPPTPSTLSFPLESAYKTLIADGWAKGITVSGDCSGSGNRTTAPATTPATFEGVAALSAVTTITISLTNCTPTSIAETATNYTDSNYVPLGIVHPGNYGVFLTPPTIPTSVTVGATGTIGTMSLYTDSTKSTPAGRIDQSYVVEADTANSAIVKLIGKRYDQSGTLLVTEQTSARIQTVGALVPVLTDLQYSGTSNIHMVWAYN